MDRTSELSPLGDEGADPFSSPDEDLAVHGWAWHWPELSWTSTGGFTAVLRAGFVILAGALGAFGWALADALAVAQPAQRPGAWGLVFAGLVLVGIVGHELGHVAAYRLVGAPWTGFVLRGRGASVRTSSVLGPGRQLIVSAAGPAAETGFAVVLLTIVAPGTVAWAAGVFALLDGLANGVVPMSRRSDAMKIWRSLARLARPALPSRGRGRAR